MLKVNKLLLGVSVCFLLTSCESPRKRAQRSEPIVIKIDNTQDELPRYVVREGDTVGSVAKNNNMTRAELIELNDLTPPYELYEGQRLIIKQSSNSIENINTDKLNNNKELNSSNDNYKFELVQEGGLSSSSTTSNNNLSDNTVLLEDSVQLDTTRNDSNNEVNNASNSASKYIWPVDSNDRTIVQHFRDTKAHTIIQVSGGAPVKAIADGIVKFAGTSQNEGTLGYGKMVLIKHKNPSRLTLYTKLGSTNVSTGQQVKKGTQIGTVARDGNLYFSLMNVDKKKKRTYIDPESILE
ncbi:MAG: M23 family metallopeptidase [Alphaproteobacteria bacterium]|nr:M23 family metallopeptidase [Alphaproteobacteria bacterium]